MAVRETPTHEEDLIQQYYLQFPGDGARVLIPAAASLDLPGNFTIAMFLQPTKVATQYVFKKARRDQTDGYEVGLSSGGTLFVRFNQATDGINGSGAVGVEVIHHKSDPVCASVLPRARL